MDKRFHKKRIVVKSTSGNLYVNAARIDAMRSPGLTSNRSNLQTAIPFAALLNLVLVIYGAFHFPSGLASGWIANLGLAGVILVLAGYEVVGRFGLRKVQAPILAAAWLFGGLAGLVFTGEILLEYILLPRDNTVYGLVEFGLAFALYLAAAVVAALNSGKAAHGALAGALSAMVASLIWYAVTLSVFFIFNGSAQQALVFRAEGNYEDFARSGMSDFNAFILQDFYGAGFFHLLLGPAIAAGLGGLAGLISKAIFKRRGSLGAV
jgi:hypothetical protein